MPPAEKMLGKLPAKIDPRTLRLANYLKAGLPDPPAALSWTKAVKRPWGMLGNDRCGDCTVAAYAHQVLAWTSNAGTAFCPSLAQCLASYCWLTGYNPATGARDTGCYELDVLNHYRQTGLGGHKIDAFAALDLQDGVQLRRSVQIFGGAQVGLALPLTARAQIEAGKPWDVTGSVRGDAAPGSWGYHQVVGLNYDLYGIEVSTWGMVQRASWPWWAQYSDENHALVSRDWIGRGGKSPSGLDLQGLLADLKYVTGR